MIRVLILGFGLVVRSMSAAVASGWLDYQLRARRVDACCALEQIGISDAESTQGGLDRAGVLMEVACDG